VKDHQRAALSPPRERTVSKKQQPQGTSKPIEPVPVQKPTRNVPKHQQCPLCFEGRGGVGKPGWWRRISGTRVKRQYICRECGFDWTADVRTTEEVLKIEYQQVEVQHRPVDLDSRG